MKIDGIDFNDDWVLSLTKAEFVLHPANAHLYDNTTRRAKLEQVYKIIYDNRRNAIGQS